ncbi:hypothetical protein [Methylomicrobium sp. Wu6]|uniref:hypothetical protein n=1 Tax=Methylomicrobium sp. Wu6 TaxID=3107928 RepID=UPI002DD69750|nr:hypothetical protein [Methylomicrobium sp. Wu6]MEC4750039.1 hypothetical protein [Methylomicrobium sp. Wu6]
MKSKLIVAACATLALTACANKYAGWEFVRLENSVPDNCVYKMQEVCTEPGLKCYNWHKQRATMFDANTVVITQTKEQHQATFSPWSGKFNSGTMGTTLAEYYRCNGAKNISPRASN